MEVGVKVEVGAGAGAGNETLCYGFLFLFFFFFFWRFLIDLAINFYLLQICLNWRTKKGRGPTGSHGRALSEYSSGESTSLIMR